MICTRSNMLNAERGELVDLIHRRIVELRTTRNPALRAAKKRGIRFLIQNFREFRLAIVNAED